MSELGDVRADLDAGVAIGIAALDALKVILDMQVKATLTITLMQRSR